jgi:hypothetical protein
VIIRQLLPIDVALVLLFVVVSVRPPRFLRNQWARRSPRQALANVGLGALTPLIFLVMAIELPAGPHGGISARWLVLGQSGLMSVCILILGRAQYRAARGAERS